MGLDLALTGLILFFAIRGWLKGFTAQAIRLAAIVSSVYAAHPVREQVKPYVMEYFPSIKPESIDGFLRWASPIVCYFAIVGVASLLVAVARRKSFGLEEPNRGDQFAGFGLGFLKGLIAASFLVAGIKYGQDHLTRISWAEDQEKESFAWEWNEKYRPATRIWSAPVVQHFVGHVPKIRPMSPPTKSTGTAEKSVQTASRVPKLELHRDLDASLDTTGLDPEVARTIESIKRELKALESIE